MDAIFKALADASRRQLLDSLHGRNGQLLRELCTDLDMTRQAVTKHLAVLEAANLVTTVRRGREKRHYLNAAPINDIAERWIDRYDRERVRALADLKQALEGRPMSKPEFVYTTYIQTTPQKLWEALTDPAFTLRYFEGTGPESDWKVGSPVKWKMAPDGEYRELGQVVLESEPYRRLSYSWHTLQPEHAEMFGWTDEEFAEAVKERSKVTFDIEPTRSVVKLTVTHDDFQPDSQMLKGISEGWPVILSSLKTLLESGETLALESNYAAQDA
jgi:uncharacterized protein YndB with AHSA1/START domain/DNA-binding transcriptional ArsR family regulator